MTTVAQPRSFVIGVDTHARTHALAGAGFEAVEAPRGYVRSRAAVEKSDPLDAAAIAAAALPLEEDRLRILRQDEGVRAALRVLVAAREQMSFERTAKINALTALARTIDLGIDARRPLSGAQVAEISRWRDRDECVATATAHAEAVRLAKRITTHDTELKANHDRVRELLEASPAAPLLEETGIGPVTAAVAYTAWSHLGRVRPEAAFAALPGVSPVPASSGNTIRHRLNRGGDRKLNKPLHMATLTRLVHDPDTRAYKERRKGRRQDRPRDPPHPQEIPRPPALPHTQRPPLRRRKGSDSNSTDIEGSLTNTSPSPRLRSTGNRSLCTVEGREQH